MSRYVVAMVFFLFAYCFVCCHGHEEGEGLKAKSRESESLTCEEGNPNVMKREISVFTVKENSTGEWVTTFKADRDMHNSTTAVNLMITQELVNCGDKRLLRITGVMRDIDAESCTAQLPNITLTGNKEGIQPNAVTLDTDKSDCENNLRFHSDFKGENVMIANNGTTASRITLEKYFAGVVTDRLLEDDEIFQVQIDRSDESWYKRKESTTAFGLIINPTKEIKSTEYILSLKGTWCLWRKGLEKDFNTIKQYSTDMTDIPDGTVLGVVRKENGDVHFFKNGIDMGLAFTGVPKGVHGFFDVMNYVTQISIVNERC